MEVSGWAQVSLGSNHYWKSSHNIPIPVLIFWSSRPCTMFCLYTLLKNVSYIYYDLSVLSMSVMGFQKTVQIGGGWMGRAPSSFILDFWRKNYFAKPLSTYLVFLGIFMTAVISFIIAYCATFTQYNIVKCP